MERIQLIWKRYKYILLILLSGILLMLWPTGKEQSQTENDSGEEFSRETMEQQMEDTLSRISGVGQVAVMLTLKSSTTLQLATDDAASGQTADGKRESQTVKLNRGSGTQEVVVTQRTYPIYQGAVVVCEGAGNSGVRLAVTEAVSVLTGLSGDRITVLQWQS